MKLDKDYLRTLLLTIENMDSPYLFLEDILKQMGLDDPDKNFVQHYDVLFDYGFLESCSENGSNGIILTPRGELHWINLQVRLTGQGHEFIEAMKKVEIWEIIKRDFKESSIKTIFTVATDLAEAFAKQHVNKLLEGSK